MPCVRAPTAHECPACPPPTHHFPLAAPGAWRGCSPLAPCTPPSLRATPAAHAPKWPKVRGPRSPGAGAGHIRFIRLHHHRPGPPQCLLAPSSPLSSTKSSPCAQPPPPPCPRLRAPRLPVPLSGWPSTWKARWRPGAGPGLAAHVGCLSPLPLAPSPPPAPWSPPGPPKGRRRRGGDAGAPPPARQAAPRRPLRHSYPAPSALNRAQSRQNCAAGPPPPSGCICSAWGWA
jgi:hypothetical protein